MSKRDTVAQPVCDVAAYETMLLEKRAQVLAGLGLKFDTIASMGRIAEEDQAQVTHDEFISLQLNDLITGNCGWWRKPSTGYGRAITASARGASGPSRRSACARCPGHASAWNARIAGTPTEARRKIKR